MEKLNLQLFGGRGASIGKGAPIGRKAKMGDFFKPKDDDSLDAEKIRRANSASLTDMGDIINRTYERGRKEIGEMDLSDAEKKDAISDLKKLSNNALDSASKAVNPFASGRSRLSTSQKTGSAADRAASDRAKVDDYMKGLRKKSSDNATRRANVNLAQQLQKAQSEGKMEVIVNGKRYYRKSKRGSWYA